MNPELALQLSDLTPSKLFNDSKLVNSRDGFFNLNNQCHEVLVEDNATTDPMTEMLYSDNYLKNIIEEPFSLEDENKIKFEDWEHHIEMTSILLSHLKTIGWDHMKKVSLDLTSLVFQFTDDKDRTHKLVVELDSYYPKSQPDIVADLPSEFKVDWPQDDGLVSVVKDWKKELCRLQHFWDVLDQIDEEAYVLHPEKPERKHKSRRLLLDNNLSIIVTISEEHPYSQPQCNVLGNLPHGTSLNEKLAHGYEVWDSEKSVVSNLEMILGVCIIKNRPVATPSTNALGMMECSAECAVCYTLRLDNLLPDYTCQHCRRCFHVQCLYQWLKSLPNSYQTVHLICGNCPFCSKSIRVSCDQLN